MKIVACCSCSENLSYPVPDCYSPSVPLRIFDGLLWFSTLVFTIGGIVWNDQIRLTYPKDLLVITVVAYGILKYQYKIKFRETSFGQGFIHAFETATKRRRPTRIDILFFILAGYFALNFILAPLMRHWTFGTGHWDFGNFYNVVHRLAFHGEFFTHLLINQDTGEPVLLFPDHKFNPGLYLVAAIYRIFPFGETLLILQSFVLLGCFPALLKLARLIFPKEVPLWIIVPIFFFFEPFHRMNIWDFHATPFILFFALWGFYFIEAKKLGLALLFMALTGIWREDGALVICGMSLYLGIRTKNWKLAAPLALVSFLFLPIFTAYFNKLLGVNDRYSYLGNSMSDAVQTIFTRPWVFIQTLFSWEHFEFFKELFVRTGLGSFLLAGWPLIALAPPLAEIALSDHPSMLNWLNHYVGQFSAPLLVCSLWGFARGVKKVGQIGIVVSVAIWISQLSILETGVVRTQLHRWNDSDCYRSIVAKIPKDAAVLTYNPFIAQLSGREWIAKPHPRADQTKANVLITQKREELVGWQIIHEECNWFVGRK